jgi:prophage regulatory protein
MTPDRLLPIREVGRLVGLSKAEIERRARAGTFPARVMLGPFTARWSEREVQEWIAARLAQREERRTA